MSSIGLLRGIPSIAEALGMKTRATRWLVECDQLPVFKLGGIWCARRSTLDKFFDQQEAAARNAQGDAK